MAHSGDLPWSTEFSHEVCAEGEEAAYVGKAPFLEASSVRQAVDLLNTEAVECPEGFCLVCSSKQHKYFLLYRWDCRDAALEALGLLTQVPIAGSPFGILPPLPPPAADPPVSTEDEDRFRYRLPPSVTIQFEEELARESTFDTEEVATVNGQLEAATINASINCGQPEGTSAQLDLASTPPCVTFNASQRRLPKWVSWGPIKGGPEFEGYFRGERPEDVEAEVIPICVPLYNEEADELVLTLRSIYRMQKMMRVTRYLEDYSVKICIIQDGWVMASNTFKAAMRVLFPPSKYEEWERRLDAAVTKKETLTCVLQAPRECNLKHLNCKDFMCELESDDEFPDELLDITLVIKADNRKKTNSHDLFFAGFASHYNPEFVFATDCGTLFDDSCLTILLQRIIREDDCVAVTGRQRVMTKDMQPGCENEGMWAWILRNVQGYDYEASVVLFNGCFSLLGGLPVIPGPCGLFRLPPLMEKTMQGGTQSPFEFYMDAAVRAETDKSMLSGNCLLAEDRVLTFAAEFLTEGKSKVHWAKNALFYFQAETQLGSLVAQRRRWLNGTVAGYIYVHNELGRKVLPSSHGSFKIFLLRVLIKLMLIMYAGIAIGPALYAYGFCEALRYLRSFHPSLFSGGSAAITGTEISWGFEAMLICIAAVYFAALVAFSIVHHRDRFDPRMFALCGVMNTVAMGVMLTAMVLSSIEALSTVQWFSFVYIAAPVLLNLFIPNFTSLTYLLNPLRVVVFYLFLPTMQGFFLTLAIARTFDLSWGNRAGIGGEQENLKKEAQTLMLLQWICNLVLLVFFFAFSTVEWFRYAQIALMVFLLTPMSILTMGSVIQELGGIWTLIALLLGTSIVFGWYAFFGWCGAVGDQIQDFLKNTPVLRGPAIQAVIVLVLIVVLKSLFTHLLRWMCHYNRNKRFNLWQEPMRRTHTLTGPVDGNRSAPPTNSVPRLLGSQRSGKSPGGSVVFKSQEAATTVRSATHPALPSLV